MPIVILGKWIYEVIKSDFFAKTLVRGSAPDIEKGKPKQSTVPHSVGGLDLGLGGEELLHGVLPAAQHRQLRRTAPLSGVTVQVHPSKGGGGHPRQSVQPRHRVSDLPKQCAQATERENQKASLSRSFHFELVAQLSRVLRHLKLSLKLRSWGQNMTQECSKKADCKLAIKPIAPILKMKN